jgi:subtilisin family serine protease
MFFSLICYLDYKNAAFSDNLSANAKVDGVSSTAGFGVQVTDQFEGSTQPRSLKLWLQKVGATRCQVINGIMVQIHVPEAYAVNPGNSSVLVGDIDTGLDHTHPDLAANVDFVNRVSCVGGVPDQDPTAWNDDNGHGTHTAGTIAAAAIGIGIVGVAPNVKIAGIKAGNSDGYFFQEAVICAFVWAGDHHIDVTNNSY